MFKIIKTWIEAMRPKTLWAGFSPVLLGICIASYKVEIDYTIAIICLATALLFQIGSNFANDYFDYKKGADGLERLGPARATSSGIISPRAMLYATVIVFVLSALGSSLLLYRGGWPIAVIGISSIMAGFLYTGGPFPLAYKGLGELFAFLFFGPVAVAGTYYLQALQVPFYVYIAGFSPGLFSIAILTVNNLRDQQSDKKANKCTLIVKYGNQFGLMEYTMSVLLALLIPVILFFIGAPPFILISVAVSGVALRDIALVRKVKGRALNPLLGATARLLLIHTILFSIGWII